MPNTEQAPSPGDVIRQELDRRGWAQSDLAAVMGRDPGDITDIISGKRIISLELARHLHLALGIDAAEWIRIQAQYQLQAGGDDGLDIVRRAKLYEFAPVKEMVRRKWIEASDSLDVMEKRVRQFYDAETLDSPISLPHAARRSSQRISQAEWAWLFQARHMAESAPAGSFTQKSLARTLKELRPLLSSVEGAALAGSILANGGIRLLIVEHLPKTRVDGATFWLGQQEPVIVLSLRYDRIDCFWFTLSHELAHIARKDTWSFDPDLVGEGSSSPMDEVESKANEFAAGFLVPQAEMNDFILRTRPLYRRDRIEWFASRIQVHPGIVVGQLQFRKEIGWSSFRPLLERVRAEVTRSTLTDGWGQLPPALE